MRFLLSGGGYAAEDRIELDSLFAAQIDVYGKILFVPVAEPDPARYEQCLTRFRDTYARYGITNIEMCTDLTHADIDTRYTAVYLGGGNTFKLLKEMKDSGFDKKLTAYLQQGGFVYGHSAGSIVFGHSILATTYETENIVGLADAGGLDLVQGFNICCHYRQDRDYKRTRIRAYAGQFAGTIALSDGCGIFVCDDEITCVGDGVVIFR